ncbi:MAG: hypothetical protein WCJ58_04295 [bacterium]
MLNKIKFILETAQIFCFSFNHKIFTRYLIKHLKVKPSEEIYLNYLLQAPLNRYAISYLHYFSEKLTTPQQQLKLIYLIGLVYAIDNQIDKKLAFQPKNVTDFAKSILNAPLENKSAQVLQINQQMITIKDFLALISQQLTAKEFKLLKSFLDQQLQNELSFRLHWQGWQAKTTNQFPQIWQYRKQTTLAYLEFLLDFSDFKRRKVNSILADTEIIQLLDDYQDFQEDLNNDLPNLFLAKAKTQGIDLRKSLRVNPQFPQVRKDYQVLIISTLKQQHNLLAKIVLWLFIKATFSNKLKW